MTSRRFDVEVVIGESSAPNLATTLRSEGVTAEALPDVLTAVVRSAGALVMAREMAAVRRAADDPALEAVRVRLYADVPPVAGSIPDIRPELVWALTQAADVPSHERAPSGHGLEVPPATADPEEFVSAVAFAAHRAVSYHALAKDRKALLDRLAALVGLDSREYDVEDVVRRLEADQGLLRDFQAKGGSRR